MKLISILVVPVLVAFAGDGYTHADQQPACSAPVRPFDDQNDVEWRRFLDQTEAFRACIGALTHRHQRASDEHQALARQSVEQWSEFVRTTLNAPEDYPWPPRDVNEQSRTF